MSSIVFLRTISRESLKRSLIVTNLIGRKPLNTLNILIFHKKPRRRADNRQKAWLQDYEIQIFLRKNTKMKEKSYRLFFSSRWFFFKKKIFFENFVKKMLIFLILPWHNDYGERERGTSQHQMKGLMK
jgi:hypothetical protein